MQKTPVVPPPTTNTRAEILRPIYPTFHRYAAARAVLAPLCGLAEAAFPPRITTVHAVQALWRQQLAGLRAAGWQPIQKTCDFAYALHCPPYSFALDGTEQIPCNKRRICPFCHGIRTSLLYENVQRVVHALRGHVNLYVLVHQQYGRPGDVADMLDAVGASDSELLGAGVKPAGTVAVTSVAPALNRPAWVVVRQAILVALRAGTSPPTGTALARRGHRVGQDDLSLARTVANVARDPVGLLYGPAEEVVALLNAIRNRQLSNTRGILRSARSATTIEQCPYQRAAPPARAALPPGRLTEEEVVVSYIKDRRFPRQRLAVHGTLARLGLPAAAHTFARATALPLRLSWRGRVRLGPRDFLKTSSRLRRALGIKEDALVEDEERPVGNDDGQGDHGFVFLEPALGFVILSTLLPGVGTAQPYLRWHHPQTDRPYVLETLGQLVERLQAPGRRQTGTLRGPPTGQ